MFFSANTYMVFLDLEKKYEIAGKIPGLAINRFSLHTISDRHHFKYKKPAERNMLANVKEYLKNNNITLREPRYFLLTNPAILGYVFNPVSFYFIYDGNDLKYIISEVNNTFGEQKPFLHTVDSDTIRDKAQKMFYVSPFISHDAFFNFEFTIPKENLVIRIYTTQNENILLDAVMKSKRIPLTAGNLFRMAASVPFMTMKVILLIHYYAMKLFLRKVPYFRKLESDNLIKKSHTEVKI